MTRFIDTTSRLQITVVICCYNAAATIAHTLGSLLAQTRAPDEILVIDDGSRDGSLEIVMEIAARNPSIRVISNGANGGTAYCRQMGLLEARSEAVMFFDADDVAENTLVERQTSLLESDPVLLGVGCYAAYFSDAGGAQDLGLQRVGPTSRLAAEKQFAANKLTFMPPVTLFRRRDALAVGGYRQEIMRNADGIRYEDFAEDLDLWCRMSDLGKQGRYFLTIAEPLFRYRKPAGSLSTRNLKLMQLKMRWIKDCLKRRRAGQAERSLAEYIASRSLADRFNDWRSDAAAGFYKRAGFAWSARRYLELAWFLGLAALASPKLIRQKLKTQTVRT